MTTTQFINDKINYLPKGYIFTYSDFLTKEKQNKEAIIKALNRMAKSGKIEKLSKGKFYKPEITRFGKLNPNNYQIVKDDTRKSHCQANRNFQRLSRERF